MSFGMWLLAVFIPPLYFAIRGRWVACIINGVFYLLSFPLLFVMGLGLFTGFLCAAHACWDLYSSLQERAIQRQATAIAEKMGRETPP